MNIDLSKDGLTFTLPPGKPEPRPYADLPKSVRRAIEDDRRWFLRHPSRSVRLRNPAPGEAESLATEEIDLPAVASGYPLRIVVLQHAPGWRVRRPVWTILDSGTPEEIILAFLRVVLDGLAQGYEGEILAADMSAALGWETSMTKH